MKHLLTRKQAEAATGKSRATLARYVKEGKLSVADKNNQGHNLFDPAELERVFGLIPPASPDADETVPQKTTMTQVNQPEADAEIMYLKKMLEEKDQIIDDLRDDRSAWRKQAEKSQLLLENSQPKKGFWPWNK